MLIQTGAFLLLGLIPDEQHDCWTSLSQLGPLIWQHEIDDIDEYSAKLTPAVSHFLHCILNVNPGWFSKKKYHLIVHLAAHIARFGPAYQFATEKFESYNSVLRSKSVHSNRLAPSRDIALAFSHSNRCRHLLSSGLLPLEGSGWRAIGLEVQALLDSHPRLLESYGWTSSSLPRPCKSYISSQCYK